MLTISSAFRIKFRTRSAPRSWRISSTKSLPTETDTNLFNFHSLRSSRTWPTGRFNPQHFTEEKMIDSLIWGYVSLLWNGGLFNGQVQYL